MFGLSFENGSLAVAARIVETGSLTVAARIVETAPLRSRLVSSKPIPYGRGS